MNTTLQHTTVRQTETLEDQITRSATLLAEYVRDIRTESSDEPLANLAARPMPPPRRKPIRRRSSISLSALLIFLTGLFCSGLCLYHGQHSWHSAVRPIQTIRVGQAVRSENPTGEEDLSLGDQVEPATWRHLILKASKTDGSFADVELLRPLWWLEEREAQVGASIDIDVPHCGIEGEAEVLAIKPCPPIEPTPDGYRTVTGTFRHHNAEVIDLYVEGLDKPIGTTPNHLFWSQDQRAFVRADSLREGEALKHGDGSITHLQSRNARDRTETVFNLEVQGTHAYCASTSGIVVHNAEDDCPKPPEAKKVKLYHGSQEFHGDNFDLSKVKRRTTKATDEQLPPAIFLTDDALRAAQQHGRGGIIASTEVAKATAESMIRPGPKGLKDYVATTQEEIDALNQNIKVQSTTDFLKNLFGGGN